MQPRTWPFALLLLCSTALPDAKLPNDRSLPLERDFHLKQIERFKTVDIPAYHKDGHRDPKQDAQALDFLETGERLVFRLDPTIDEGTLRAQGKAILDSGCNDPLVVYCYGRLLQRNRDAKAANVIRRALAEFDKRPGAAHWKMAALKRIIMSGFYSDEARKAGERLANEVVPAYLAEPFTVKHPDVALEELHDLIEVVSALHSRPIIDAICDARNFDPTAPVTPEAANATLSADFVEMYLDALSYRSEFFREVPMGTGYGRDPDDEAYLDLAIAGAAEFLVTNDKDLLSLSTAHTTGAKEFRQRHQNRLVILRPAEFLDSFRGM